MFPNGNLANAGMMRLQAYPDDAYFNEYDTMNEPVFSNVLEESPEPRPIRSRPYVRLQDVCPCTLQGHTCGHHGGQCAPNRRTLQILKLIISMINRVYYGQDMYSNCTTGRRGQPLVLA